MSDFLTNLAARAIAQPSLRPRTRSRFEPAEEAPPEWPMVSVARRPLAGRSAGGLAGGVPRVEHEEKSTGRLPVDLPASGRRAEQPPEPRIEPPPPEVRVEREIERNVQRVVQTQERVVRVPEEIERVVETRPHRYERQPPRVIRERDEFHRERVERTTIDRRPQILTQQAPPAEITQERTIQVSIGRIEVRAVSQQQPQRERARGDRMTIDDYVARRKAKERR